MKVNSIPFVYLYGTVLKHKMFILILNTDAVIE